MHDSMDEILGQSFISKLHFSISNGLPHAEPLPSCRTDEQKLVHGILGMLQGFCSYLFFWDENEQKFRVEGGIYACHLSKASLSCILNKFIFCGTCLKKVETSRQRVPTLKAFANSVHFWLKKLRGLALKEEIKSVSGHCQTTMTLLDLMTSLSRDQEVKKTSTWIRAATLCRKSN
ncbi:hypothetical protein HPP92_009870 [Vanilla planifolia]|uniref:Gamma-tubulin complex component n=1 Tax=Vanilla planifolia TaxID=51239 RepID=A0A835R301_VANPL|nr:hypothetical protein HPP92_009870 [Vanilla planifolia]